MELSELYPHSSHKAVQWSPDGRWLATILKRNLIIRDAESLQVLQLFTCANDVQDVIWSPDSTLVLCTEPKKSMLQIFSLRKQHYTSGVNSGLGTCDWTCKIEEGVSGLSSVRWSPDSSHVLTVADFQTRLTVWSLTKKSALYFSNPKSSEKGIAFSASGSYFALLQRKDCKDFISIFNTDDWELLHEIKLDTVDASDIIWSPDERTICVYDHVLEYRVLFYSIDGRLLHQYQAYENALGIRSASWSPLLSNDQNSHYIAIGSYDQKVRVINPLTWKVIAEFSHPMNVVNAVAIYREVPSESIYQPSNYVIEEGPVSIPHIKPQMEANPKMGVVSIKWSPTGNFFFTKNDNMSNVLWIWDATSLSLHSVLIQKEAIKSAFWHSQHDRLALSTASNTIYLWSVNGASCVQVPVQGAFTIATVRWNIVGDAILLLDKNQHCVCYFQTEEL